jgi:hypothetical protein
VHTPITAVRRGWKKGFLLFCVVVVTTKYNRIDETPQEKKGHLMVTTGRGNMRLHAFSFVMRAKSLFELARRPPCMAP